MNGSDDFEGAGVNGNDDFKGAGVNGNDDFEGAGVNGNDDFEGAGVKKELSIEHHRSPYVYFILLAYVYFLSTDEPSKEGVNE